MLLFLLYLSINASLVRRGYFSKNIKNLTTQTHLTGSVTNKCYLNQNKAGQFVIELWMKM